jgi:hypothetical protein
MSDKLTMEEFAALDLTHGKHDTRESGVCVMEAVAWLAGREHTDAPSCVSKPIAAGLIAWNDGLPNDQERNRLLKPLALPVIGTAAPDAVEHQRSLMALDWSIRTWLPTWLDLLPSLATHAAAVRALAAVNDDNASAAGVVVRAARDAAGAAAGDAARAAAGDAARDAAGAAARAAAWAAARDAAGDAARKFLKPTVLKLQASAQEMFLRMAALGAGERGRM